MTHIQPLCRLLVAIATLLLAAGSAPAIREVACDEPAPETRPGSPVVKSEFIYDTAPFPSAHASTIVQTRGGLVAAWFGGRREGADDVGIWLARHDGKAWSAPVEVATGKQPDGKQLPCWNPVLFQPKAAVTEGDNAGGKRPPLLLFYKVGPSPSGWWGMLMTSEDDGRSWSEARRLPDGILGPIKNKPTQLADGTLLCGSSTEDGGWRLHVERTIDLGKTWTKTDALNDGKAAGLIQPTILDHGGGRLHILCRSRQGKVFQTWSSDGGKTWDHPVATDLPNPNSGTDAVRLADGRTLLVYNHTTTGRSPLNVAVSPDGKHWKGAAVLEDARGEYSYPAVIQTTDGMVHVTYTWNRQKIKHVVIDPKLMGAAIDVGNPGASPSPGTPGEGGGGGSSQPKLID